MDFGEDDVSMPVHPSGRFLFLVYNSAGRCGFRKAFARSNSSGRVKL
jgi:hypothetical protein